MKADPSALLYAVADVRENDAGKHCVNAGGSEVDGNQHKQHERDG